MAEGPFGVWLRERRKALDLTRDELALRVGCSPALIRKIEAGERRVSKQIAALLASNLDIPTDEHVDFVRFARSLRARCPPDSKSPWRTWRLSLTNLPVPPAPLFGRMQEIESVVHLIVNQHVRLLTIVGPPGVGKTRLAIASADALLDRFDDGVYFVGLAPIRDPALVLVALARVFGLKDAPEESLLDRLGQYLAGKRMLILFDNFEQVQAAAPLLADLLAHCPWLQLLVTSRVSLHLRQERQLRIAPLALPPTEVADKPETCLEYPAVQFFVDRARSVDPNLTLSAGNILAYAGVCVRLDGLPLAIELVASRADTFSPDELLCQIDRRLAFSTSEFGDLPRRHQSLRAALGWSMELLDATSQTMFERVSIFTGGWSTPMASAICGEGISEPEVAKALLTLADASLVVKAKEPDGQVRWSMLETIREYAAERLDRGGQQAEIAKRHAAAFLAFAESAAPNLNGPHQVAWLNQLNRDHGNLHAAIQWSIEQGEADLALRLGGALGFFWYKQGWLVGGRAWLRQALAQPRAPSVELPVRQNALFAASLLAWSYGAYEEADRLAQESCTLAVEMGDRQVIGRAINMLANVAADRSDFTRAVELFESSLAIRRDLGSKEGIASSLNNLGRIAYYRGESSHAIAYYEESLALQRDLGDRFSIALALNNLGGALADNLQDLERATSLLQESLRISSEPETRYHLVPFTTAHLGRAIMYTGDITRAEAILEQSVETARQWRSKTGLAFALLHLACLALRRKDVKRAESLLTEGLELQRTFEDTSGAVHYLAAIATLFCAQGCSKSAAAIAGAVSGLCESTGLRLPPAYLAQYDATVSSTRSQLDEDAYATAFEYGHKMTLPQAYDYVWETIRGAV